MLFLHDELSWIQQKEPKEHSLSLSIPSSTTPIPHCQEKLVPVFKELLDIPVSAASLAQDPVPQESIESDSDPGSLDDDNHIDYHECSIEPNRFNQDDLSNLNRDLNLPKESAELLTSRFKCDILQEQRC